MRAHVHIFERFAFLASFRFRSTFRVYWILRLYLVVTFHIYFFVRFLFSVDIIICLAVSFSPPLSSCWHYTCLFQRKNLNDGWSEQKRMRQNQSKYYPSYAFVSWVPSSNTTFFCNLSMYTSTLCCRVEWSCINICVKSVHNIFRFHIRIFQACSNILSVWLYLYDPNTDNTQET